MLMALFRGLRPVQWVKNLFVLAPIVFAERLDDPELLTRAALAFVAFCCAASAVYLLNDLRDRHEDRLHPLKRHRPIASGELSVPVAWTAFAVLALVSLGSSLVLGWIFGGIVALYLAINVAYSGGLKHVVILDVMAVSAGYVLRVMAGGEAVSIRVSPWLLLCTIFLALFLVFSKRRHELVLMADEAADHRAVLHHYSETYLDQMINVVTASTVICYALYAVDDDTVARFGSEALVYTVPLVLFGVFRYLYLIYQRPERRNPTEALLRDLPFVSNVLIWGLVVLWIVYG